MLSTKLKKSQKLNFKKTELGEIPSEWDYEILDNFLEHITYGFTNPMPTTDSGPFMITAKDIKNGKINYTTARHTATKAFDDLLTDKSKPFLNDVLITKDGTIGRVAIVDTEGICINQSVALLRTNNRIRPVYLKYLLESRGYQKLIERDLGGTTIKHIYITRINKMLVGVPSLEEQDKILNILSALDDKIELNLQMNKTLEAMAMALYKHWFVDFAPFQDGEFVESELGRIPKGWEVKSVKDFGDVVTGKTPSKKFPEHFGHDTPFVTPTGFKNYRMHITGSERMISKQGFEKYKKSIIPSNSVIVTCIGSDMGKVSISKVECLTNQQINSLKCEHYLFMYFFFVKSYKLLKRLAGDGTTMPIINKSSFENIKVIYAPKKILQNFEELVSRFDKKCLSNTLENKTLTQLRDTLLPKLISGEVRVREVVKKNLY